MLSPVSAPRAFGPGVHIALIAALFLAFELYGPALDSPFQFDDKSLPFAVPRFENQPLSTWISGNRPVLMFSYWLNSALDGINVSRFHAVNILLHFLNSVMAFLVLRHFITTRWLAVLLGGVFLVHPLQTESVSYIAGRSESLCAFFFLTAYTIFLWRPPGPIGWGRSAGIVALYAAAILTKEHGVVLPALLLLTDAFQSPNSIRRNWRLYLPISALALTGLAMVARVLATSNSAGFNTRGVTWDQYALTQTRAIFHYIRLALLPVGQSIDHDFPISRTPFEHHAWIFLAALLIAAATAYHFRRQYPLAAFGAFAFLIMLAPTSSIVPIADPFAERRMYLPLLALLLVAAEALRRFRISIPTGVFILAILSFLTYQRNRLWSDPVAFWLDTVRLSPQKGRPHSHLAEAAIGGHQCAAVAPVFEDARKRLPNDYHVLTGYAKILECVNQPEEAAGLLRQAAKVRPSSEVFELLGLLYGEMENTEASRRALESAIRINPGSASAHLAMGLWYHSARDWANAANSYRRVLEIEPFNRSARAALRTIDVNWPGGP
jgi:protein O-mannosyl-transferase